jgi:D-tyrosyl-tRNA(Tyr) deacylase
MRVLLQRVIQAHVDVDGKTVGKIQRGLVIFLGVAEGDSEKEALFLTDKIINLRIFEDSLGKMNLSILDMKEEILVVSQFTLYGDCRHGRRPSFTKAASPILAEKLYNFFVDALKKHVVVQTGIFKAYMQVSLTNDGPVTFLLDSE